MEKEKFNAITNDKLIELFGNGAIIDAQYQPDYEADLKKEVWRHSVNLRFDETKIPVILEIQAKALEELNGDGGLKDQLEKLNSDYESNGKKKETRVEIARMKNKITTKESFILSCDETISQINNGIMTTLNKIDSLLQRVAYSRDYKFDIAALLETKNNMLNPKEVKKEEEVVDEKDVYDGPMAKYKITGKAEYTDEQGNVEGELEIGSIQELPTPVGDVFVEKGVAEKVTEEMPEPENLPEEDVADLQG